jgi:hypothetical protein
MTASGSGPQKRHRGDADGAAHHEPLLHAQERWLDLIADLIVDDLCRKEPGDADALRSVRQV